MNIVYCLTEDFVEKAIPSMRSLLKHNPKAKIYLLTETDTTNIPVPVTVVNISNWKDTFKKSVNLANNFGGYINLVKVCYPDILKVNKVIHLDADTIICDSLEPLWKTDIKGKDIAAVPEYRGQYNPFGATYYNMGVALINLQQLRTEGLVPTMIDYLNTVRQPFADQDAWNKYCSFVPVDIRYNENFATGITENPAIVHYCGRTDWYDNPGINRVEYLNAWRSVAHR